MEDKVIPAGLKMGLTVICLWLAAAGSAMGQPAQPGQPAVAATNPQAPLVSDPDYALGEGDVVEVLVVGSPEFNSRARVSRDGSILLPLLGPVPAAGASQSALAERVAAGLKAGGYYSNPIVRVELIGIRSRYVTVLGNISAPGLLPLDRPYRLSEILAKVGGKTAIGAEFVVLTRANGESKRYPIEKLATGGPTDDPVVQAGDKIFVPAAENEVFYVTGEVKSPGAFPVQSDMSLRIALARAGGLTENGSDRRVNVVRGGKTLKGVKLEQTVEPGDIITVGARLF
jgi:polysaccharide biosynthesis/export protein